MGHLKPSPPEAALDVETLVRLGAVQNGLVAADLLSYEVERLDDAQAEFLALLVLGDGDVFDVADETEVVDEFTLDDEGAGADDARSGVEDGDHEVLVVVLREPLVALVPLLCQHMSATVLLACCCMAVDCATPCRWVGWTTYLFCNIADRGKHAQHVQKAFCVVASLQRPDCVAVGEL